MSEKPTIATTEPIAVEADAGEVFWWCSCGRSKNQPFCDGSHAGSAFQPQEVKAEEAGTLWFCGCKATGTPPFCDGSHNDL